jgi:hypothetical protein
MMKRIAQLVSWLALAGTLVPSCIFYYQGMELAQVKLWMLVFTVVWFLVTPVWMEHKIES